MGKQKRKTGAHGGEGEWSDPRDRRRNDRLIKQQFRKNRQRVQYGDQNWNRDWKKFLEQLAPLGLTIKDVAGDGNCLFRSMADQLEGDPNRYAEYRATICNFIEEHREDFEPFIEDDQTFDKYLANMRRNTTWGGNIEIQAASLVYNINICIHQLEQPRWEISNFDGANVRTIHLSYHQGDHYASVRRTDEMKVNGAAPKAIVIGESTKSLDFKNNDPKTKKKPITYEEKQVIDATGCQNLEFIRKVMEDNYYDTYATIEFISVIDPEDKNFIKEYMKGGSALNWEEEQYNEINIVSVDSPVLPETSSNNNSSSTSTSKPKIKLSENEQKVVEVTGCKNIEFIRESLRDNQNDIEMTVQFLFLLDPEDPRLQVNTIDEPVTASKNSNTSSTSPTSGTIRPPVMIDLNDCNEDERMIMEMTNCYNLELIRAALVEYQYNTDLAIEYIMNTVTKPNNDIKNNNSARNVSPTKNNGARKNNNNEANNSNNNNNNNNNDGDNNSRNPYHGKKKGGKVQSLSDHDSSSGPIHPKLAKFADKHLSNRERKQGKQKQVEVPPPAPVRRAETDPEPEVIIPEVLNVPDLGSLKI